MGHACVAYDYDEATNEVYFHAGWHTGSTRRTLSNMGYDTYRGYLVIRFNIDHKHSNNYTVVQGDGTYKYYCYCSDKVVTYKHDKCNYTLNYKTVSDKQHFVSCVCEDSITENHSYTWTYGKSDQFSHAAYCRCGAQAIYPQKHTWIDGFTINGVDYMRCKYCSFSKPKGSLLLDLIDESLPSVL